MPYSNTRHLLTMNDFICLFMVILIRSHFAFLIGMVNPSIGINSFKLMKLFSVFQKNQSHEIINKKMQALLISARIFYCSKLTYDYSFNKENCSSSSVSVTVTGLSKPWWRRIDCLIVSRISLFSFKNCLAFSRPCPRRSSL